MIFTVNQCLKFFLEIYPKHYGFFIPKLKRQGLTTGPLRTIYRRVEAWETDKCTEWSVSSSKEKEKQILEWNLTFRGVFENF